jgi:hypothetical protein
MKDKHMVNKIVKHIYNIFGGGDTSLYHTKCKSVLELKTNQIVLYTKNASDLQTKQESNIRRHFTWARK